MSHPTQAELIRQGAELFNRGEYFACHEVFEEAWMAARGDQRAFLQGLIQVAVALHHITQGNPAGAKRLLAEGIRKLRGHQAAQGWITVEPLLNAAEGVLLALQAGRAAQLDPPPQISFGQ